MKIGKFTQTRLLESAIPISLFMTGVSLCVLIKILNIFWMACVPFPDSNYITSKGYYVWICEVSLLAFIVLGLSALIGSKKKVFSIALIITCICSSINVFVTKNILISGHKHIIYLLEEAIAQHGYEPDKEWHKVVVKQWNEVQKEKHEPAI